MPPREIIWIYSERIRRISSRGPGLAGGLHDEKRKRGTEIERIGDDIGSERRKGRRLNEREIEREGCSELGVVFIKGGRTKGEGCERCRGARW